MAFYAPLFALAKFVHYCSGMVLQILFLKYHSHLFWTRHAHQVTALALAKLQEYAFMHTDGEHNDTAREVWKQKMKSQSPTFQYQDTILNMELSGLSFIRPQSE